MRSLRTLLRDEATLTQLEILKRADYLFKGRGNRYYSGPLSDEDVKLLTDNLTLQKS